MVVVSGEELRVGDVIGVWWSAKRDTITSLQPYTGPLSYLWGDKAQLAEFAVNRTGMTIEPHMQFEVFNRQT